MPAAVLTVLAADEWRVRSAAHETRIDRWAGPRTRGESHPVHDLLFTYYSQAPGRLRRWHPGIVPLDRARSIRCSHFDAFRFSTPEAAGRNRLQPAPETQAATEQPGCLHATMALDIG